MNAILALQPEKFAGRGAAVLAGALLAAPAEAAVSTGTAYAFNSFSFLVCGALVTIASAILWFAIRAVVGLRIDAESETLGLDQVELGIEAYAEFGKGSQTI